MDLVTLAVAKKYVETKIAEAAVGGVDVTEYVNERVDQLINGASGTFDTLGEIETAVKKKVDNTTTINNKALSSNISLSASDVGAVPTTRTINGRSLSGNITLSAADVGALPNTTTIPNITGLATEEYVNTAVSNIVLTSAGGKKFKLTVDDAGVLTATEITE